MTRQSHIVSFDDARRAQQGRASQSARTSRRYADRASSDGSTRPPRTSRERMSSFADRSGSARGFSAASSRFPREGSSRSMPASSRDVASGDRAGSRRQASSASRLDLASGSRRRFATAERPGSSARFESSRRDRADRADDGVSNAAAAADDAASEGESERGSSLGSRFLSKRDEAKRARAKEKADKRFNRQYGSSSSQGAEAAGPRAAVYKGEMGAQHRKAARMQDDPSSRNRRSSSAKAAPKRGLGLSRFATAGIAVAACLVVGCVMLYGPAQQCYQEIRERDRLQAEYAAIEQRNSAIQSEVDALSTSSGVEDRAREEFGWVKEGESMAAVAGVDAPDEESSFTANIVPGTIEAPETWYSEILDPIFGVK